jgi:hypothetical protein
VEVNELSLSGRKRPVVIIGEEEDEDESPVVEEIAREPVRKSQRSQDAADPVEVSAAAASTVTSTPVTADVRRVAQNLEVDSDLDVDAFEGGMHLDVERARGAVCKVKLYEDKKFYHLWMRELTFAKLEFLQLGLLVSMLIGAGLLRFQPPCYICGGKTVLGVNLAYLDLMGFRCAKEREPCSRRKHTGAWFSLRRETWVSHSHLHSMNSL